MLQFTWAKAGDFLWINEKYREIQFQESQSDHDQVLIATWKGERAGLGRIVKISNDAAELGGITIFTAFRGKGLATAVVEKLVQEAKSYPLLYCLPFEHLISFYKKMGFRSLTKAEVEVIPEEIKKKHSWCNGKYQQKTGLMIFHSHRE